MKSLNVTPAQLKFSKANKSIGWLYLPPKDFLALTVPNASVDAWISEEAGHTRTVDDYNSYGSKDLPWLDVDIETGRVVGHEGRHRAIATLNAESTKFPVSISLRKDGYPCYFRQPFIDQDVPNRFVKEYLTAKDCPVILLGQFVVSRHVRLPLKTMQSFWG